MSVPFATDLLDFRSYSYLALAPWLTFSDEVTSR